MIASGETPEVEIQKVLSEKVAASKKYPLDAPKGTISFGASKASFPIFCRSVPRQTPPPIGPLGAESPGKVYWPATPLDVDQNHETMILPAESVTAVRKFDSIGPGTNPNVRDLAD
jgi:hypothetical protein